MSLLLLFGGKGVAAPAAPLVCYPTSALVTRGVIDRGSTSGSVARAARTNTNFSFTLGSGGMIILGSGPYTPPGGINTSASVARSVTNATVARTDGGTSSTTARRGTGATVTRHDGTTSATVSRRGSNGSVTRRGTSATYDC